MKLSLIIEAIAKGRGIDQTRRAMGGLDRDTRRAAGGIAQADRAMGRAERSADRLSRAGYRIGYGIGRGTRQAIGGLIALERRLTLTRAQAGKLGLWAGRHVGGGIRTGATIAAGGVLAGAYQVARAGLQMERMRRQLRGLEGSAAGANAAGNWVRAFPKVFAIDEVTQAYIALRTAGVDPMDGSLRVLGETAADTGKSLTDAAEIIINAQGGEFASLKDFGIGAKAANDRVVFSFDRNGKRLTRVARNNAASIRASLLEILGGRFSGGIDRLAKDTEGKWTVLMNRMTAASSRVWEGGVGASVNRVFDTIESRIAQAEADGSLKRWAEDTGRGVGAMVDELGNADWKGIGADLREVGGAFRDIAGAIRQVRAVGSGIGGFLTNTAKGLELAGNLTGIALNRRIGISERAGQTLKAWVGPAPRPAPTPGKPYTGTFLQPAPRIGTRGWQTQIPKGMLQVEITTPDGVKAKPKKISATGIDLEVKTGRVMKGAA
jgi:hypothetical protein